jgi:hypothetical protein
METEKRHRPYKKALWGIFLMALGGAFLAARLGYYDLPSIWKLWPTALLVAGAGSFLERRPGSGTMLTLMALAFFAAEFRFMGLSWPTFWPLLLIAVGAGIVVGVFSREDERCGERKPCTSAEAPHE